MERETVKEITEIVQTCNQCGINNIFVSGLTCRPEFETEINQINRLLEENAETGNYIFINNTNIHEHHLWSKDKLHLSKNGTIILANNFLENVNRKFMFDNFY